MSVLVFAFGIRLVTSGSGRASVSNDSFIVQESWAEKANIADLGEDSAELVVGIKKNCFDDVKNLASRFGSRLGDIVSVGNDVVAVVSEMSSEAISRFVSEARSTNLVRYIEPRMRFAADFVSNDPYENLQWALKKISAQAAWSITTGDSDIILAIVDTGIDYHHPDLDANYVALGYDWVNDDSDPMDDNGHGTHCAGIVAAELNNSIGIAGVAQVRIMAEKGLCEYGWGWSNDLANAITHAVNQGAQIISCSWGSGEDSELIHEAIRYAHESDVLIISSAGNDAWHLESYPAAYEEVIAVAATDRADEPTSFTNYGDWIELSAPGSNIFSTMPNSAYAYMGGTSMSTPYVAGVAALVWSRFPSMTPDQVRQHLLKTSNDLGELGFDVYYGYGRVNASTAVDKIWPESDILILGWQKKHVTVYTQPGEELVVNATIFNFGTNSQSSVTTKMMVNGTIIESEAIDFLQSGKSETLRFPWMSPSEGLYNFTVYAVPLADESVTDNNVFSINVRVRTTKTLEVKENQRIQDKINSAYPGDTIQIVAGTFHENLTINKSLSLIGSTGSATIIDGNRADTVIHVLADNVTVSNLTVRNGNRGLCLECSNRNVIVGNTIQNCSEGLILLYSGSNFIAKNSMNGNEHNFCVDGDFRKYLPLHFMQDLDSSNTVDGKPIYYWVNQHDKQVPSDAGFVAVINSINITVKDLELRMNSQGMLFAYTSNSVVDNVYASNNSWGMLLVGSSDNMIQNNTVSNNDCGIQLHESFNNEINNNVVAANKNEGIKLTYSDKNLLSGNIASSNHNQAISLEYSFENKISNNTVYDNREGLSITWSGHCVLRDNNLTRNDHNLGVEGDYLSDFILDIDTSNIVNGMKVFYLVNQHRLEINPFTFPNPGYLAAVNCTEIMVENLSLADNSNGILFAYTSNSAVENVNVSNCLTGIDLISCEKNRIFENTIRESYNAGISLHSSEYNDIASNKIVASGTCGIGISGSRNNELRNNELSGSRYGGGVLLDDSSRHNSLKANLVKDNLVGIFVGVDEPHANRIYHNNFINNPNQVLTLDTFWLGLNYWDDGKEQGNYWSNYEGEDSNADGIGDTLLPHLGLDQYPLMTKYWNAADVNHDGKIDILDISLVANCYSCGPGDEKWKPSLDLDNNGIINIVDITIVAKDHGKTA